jgi:hypothetical protein
VAGYHWQRCGQSALILQARTWVTVPLNAKPAQINLDAHLLVSPSATQANDKHMHLHTITPGLGIEQHTPSAPARKPASNEMSILYWLCLKLSMLLGLSVDPEGVPDRPAPSVKNATSLLLDSQPQLPCKLKQTLCSSRIPRAFTTSHRNAFLWAGPRLQICSRPAQDRARLERLSRYAVMGGILY